MISLHAAGITDVGRVRQGNEDALHVGDSVFAVADGMGGHQAGEVASALALEPIATLDGRVFGDVEEAREALVDAVVEANRSVVDAAAHDNALSGMGTTLTAALFEGRRLHVAHVGDSRAYLLRDGVVVQLTRDHTFVQQLLDDGRITADEVATHPHRSVITRAIGARADVEVDLETIELRHDDAVLLCSDGLSGVVAESTIAELLTSQMTPSEIVSALVDEANAAGGPDNITAVLLTVVAPRTAAAADATAPDGDAEGAGPDDTADLPAVEAPAGATVTGDDDASEVGEGEQDETGDGPRGPQPPMVIRPDGNAGRMRPLPGPGPDESLVVDPAVRRRRIAGAVVAVATVLGIVLGGGRWLLSRSYYVGLDGGDVVVYRGIPAALGPLDLSWVHEETGLQAEQLPSEQVRNLEEGIAAVDAGDARDLVRRLRAAADAEQADDEQAVSDTDAGATDAPSDATDTGASPSPTPDATP